MTKRLLFIVLLALVACSPMVYTSQDPGVPNLARVDESIYRSGQITTVQGWETIARLAAGRTVHVIKLNYDHEGRDAYPERDGWNLDYLPIQPEGDRDWLDDIADTFRHPDHGRIDAAVAILGMCKRNPRTDFCLVHCTHGQDRTGDVVGHHRVTNDGWTKDQAYAEMLAHHFHPELRGIADDWEEFAP